MTRPTKSLDDQKIGEKNMASPTTVVSNQIDQALSPTVEALVIPQEPSEPLVPQAPNSDKVALVAKDQLGTMAAAGSTIVNCSLCNKRKIIFTESPITKIEEPSKPQTAPHEIPSKECQQATDQAMTPSTVSSMKDEPEQAKAPQIEQQKEASLPTALQNPSQESLVKEKTTKKIRRNLAPQRETTSPYNLRPRRVISYADNNHGQKHAIV